MTLGVTEAELRELIREQTPHLLAVARGFARGDTEAEDILQEVWWRAARRAGDRAEGVPLRAWLVAVTVNVGRDHHRKARRRATLLRLWGWGRAVTPPSPDPRHEGTALWRAVGELPRLQRDVVLLRIIEGYSTEECARLLARAEGTIKVSLARGLAKLRARFDEEERWIPDTTRPING